MQTALLDNVAHANLRLRRGAGAELGDPAGQVGIFLAEIPQVQREYPILFARDEGGRASPMAILGLTPNEVLFARDGHWDARYLPALMRKGPFLLGKSDADDPIVHVICDHPRVTQTGCDSDSDPLFLPHGGYAPALEDALDALRIIHSGLAPTEQFGQALDELGLIQPLSFDVQLSDTSAVRFDNFHGILPEAVASLSAEQLNGLNSAGFLHSAILIAHSLGNMNDLVRRKRMREG